MTANRRIFLNIIATYGRSLYALVCGVFISRWMLAAEKSEFGVCGMVGGMMVIELLAYTMRQDCGGKLLWQFTVAIKCDPVAPPPEMTTWMIVGIVVGAFPVSEFSHKPVANMIHYTPYESGQ